MSNMQKVWAAFGLIAAILIIPPGLDLAYKHADPPPAPVLSHQMLVCVDEEHGLYDTDEMGRCPFGGFSAILDAETMEMLYRRATEKAKLTTCGSTSSARSWDSDIDVTIILPPDPPAEKSPDFFDDPLQGVWDGAKWLIDKGSNAIALDP